MLGYSWEANTYIARSVSGQSRLRTTGDTQTMGAWEFGLNSSFFITESIFVELDMSWLDSARIAHLLE